MASNQSIGFFTEKFIKEKSCDGNSIGGFGDRLCDRETEHKYRLEVQSAPKRSAGINGRSFAGDPGSTIPKNFSSNAVGVDRRALFRDLTKARKHFGLSPGAIQTLEAIVFCSSDEKLVIGKNPIRFPSNATLSQMTRGTAASTLRTHFRVLIAKGLLARKDSPNRHRRRNNEEVYGFDISPLVARAAEIARYAKDADDENEALKAARNQVSIRRRELGDALLGAFQTDRTVALADLHKRFCEHHNSSLRSVKLPMLEAELSKLESLCSEFGRLSIFDVNTSESSANDIKNERHIQRTREECLYMEETEEREKLTSGSIFKTKTGTAVTHTFGQAIRAFPKFAEQCGQRVLSSDQDFIRAAESQLGYLSIVHHTYGQACKAMGPLGAATTVAYIFEQEGKVKLADAYFRSLIAKFERGGYSPAKTVYKFLRDNEKVSKTPENYRSGNSDVSKAIRPDAEGCSSALTRSKLVSTVNGRSLR